MKSVRVTGLIHRRLPLAVLALGAAWLALAFPAPTSRPSSAAAQAPATGESRRDEDAQDDLAAKSELLQSPRWRRAIFELGEWLSTQQIYSARDVQRIKSDFNTKVMKMSSHELEYLLDDLEAKFKVMDTPEAREARAWVGQYLSAMSDRKRSDILKDVPNVIDMSAGQLSQELVKIDQKRQSLRDRQAAFDEGRQVLANQANANRKATADAATAATARMNSSPSYSPYRSNGGGSAGGSPPFSNARVGSGMSIGVGPFGAYVGFSLGNF
jgi:hypothetical protein